MVKDFVGKEKEGVKLSLKFLMTNKLIRIEILVQSYLVRRKEILILLLLQVL